MHPAYSVIFFTVSSGAGFGLLAILAIGLLFGAWHPEQTGAAGVGVALVFGLVLALAGLLSSTFHLGHPERAWRALSQWRTSWLSREGVLAVASLIAIVFLLMAWWLPDRLAFLLRPSALLVALLVLLTVFSTAMIYASLKTIPRWNQPLVVPVYLLFALTSGAVLTLLFVPDPRNVAKATTMLLLVVTWVCKWLYWRRIDRALPVSTAETATGLGAPGSVRPLDPPHTSANYVQKEMGFVIARKHAVKLRRLSLAAGLLLPLVGVAGAWNTGSITHVLFVLLAVAGLSVALLIERWLFFAEAEHVVTLYYGKPSV